MPGLHVVIQEKPVRSIFSGSLASCPEPRFVVVDAALGEIMTTCSKMEWILKHGQRALRPEKRSTNFILSYKSAAVHYEPLGVVAAIVSWNYRS